MAKTDVARRVTHDIRSYLVTKRVELQVAQHRPVLADTPKFEDGSVCVFTAPRCMKLKCILSVGETDG